jgi:hypothetical protein
VVPATDTAKRTVELLGRMMANRMLIQDMFSNPADADHGGRVGRGFRDVHGRLAGDVAGDRRIHRRIGDVVSLYVRLAETAIALQSRPLVGCTITP